MKKILIISPDIPYPLTKGGRQGVFHFIDKLRDRYDISLLFILDNIDKESYIELSSLWNNVTFYPLERPAIQERKESLFSKLYNLPYKVKDKIMYYSKKNDTDKVSNSDFVRDNSTLNSSLVLVHSKEFIDYVTKIATQEFDIIQVEFYPLLSLVHILPANVEKIFIHHELRYVRNEIEMSFFQKVTNWDKYVFKSSKLFEIETLRLYDKIVTVTDIDKLKLEQELEGKSIFASPSMVNMPEDNLSYKYKFNNKLTFVASAAHFPNYDGIKWFISNIWQQVYKKHPELELHIIGGGWNAEMFQDIELPKNIFFDGYVKDLKDILPNSISIIPIRIGSGMRMKIIDAVNFKIPFITTSVGVEGLDFINGRDCLIADDANSFAQHITDLTKNELLQNNLILSSHNTLRNMYNEDILINKRMLVYETSIPNKKFGK
ncbi:glycosyltransferase [Dysgonomonas sp. ZJ709]|uniref:glycosyltransferase n=1 Tax=Dysgonomonas sp. ZJ709 TaxID=2709797 RepID=UPI0013EC7571|nr:glycosyltransferase [Dysgonomonas sp. ZJ709]